MKKIYAILSSLLFIFLLVSCSTLRINTKSLSLEEQRAYYRNLVENPPADIENYKFSDYDIKMILEVKEDIRKEQHIKELKAEREKYIPKEENFLKNNKKRWRAPSEEEKEIFEKIKQNNQQKLEQMDKVIMLLEEE